MAQFAAMRNIVRCWTANVCDNAFRVECVDVTDAEHTNRFTNERRNRFGLCIIAFGIVSNYEFAGCAFEKLCLVGLKMPLPIAPPLLT